MRCPARGASPGNPYNRPGPFTKERRWPGMVVRRRPAMWGAERPSDGAGDGTPQLIGTKKRTAVRPSRDGRVQRLGDAMRGQNAALAVVIMLLFLLVSGFAPALTYATPVTATAPPSASIITVGLHGDHKTPDRARRTCQPNWDRNSAVWSVFWTC